MYPKLFKKLFEHFSSLPSVGPKMAERLTLHLFKQPKETLNDFAESLRAITGLRSCSRCFHIAENDLCGICSDPHRDTTLLCVVEEPMDVIAIERTGRYTGRYHVLGGTMEVSPKKHTEHTLHISELLERIEKESVAEVILATNPTTEGDLTALYLGRKLEGHTIKITRLGRGLSTGGDIEYADELTLSSALTHRRTL
jgi:recombination protein RecR